MDMDKNMLLVKTVEKFPCLYESNSIEYLTRPLTEQAWLEVSKETKLAVQECKEKWKNLRYGLLRSLRPTRHGWAKKQYYLHNEMKFLLPYMSSIAKSKVKTENQVEEFDVHDENEEDSFEHTFEINRVLETYSDNQEPSNKKPKINETQYNYDEQEKNIRTHTLEEDPRRLFLLSLLPEISDFSENQMRTFRRRIFGLLDEINLL